MIYIMRHGMAEDYAESDAHRRLVKEGREVSQKVAEEFLKREWEIPTKCITSEYLRAKETAEIVAEVLNIHDVKEVSPGDISTWEKMKSFIQDENILFVGHEPDLSSIIQEATGKILKVKKSSIHKIDYDFMADRADYVEGIFPKDL